MAKGKHKGRYDNNSGKGDLQNLVNDENLYLRPKQKTGLPLSKSSPLSPKLVSDRRSNAEETNVNDQQNRPRFT